MNSTCLSAQTIIIMTGSCLFRAHSFLLIFLFETNICQHLIMDECEVLNFYCNTLPSSDVSMNISRILMQACYCSKYSEYYRQADPNSSNNPWKYMKLTLKQCFIFTVCLNTLIQDQIHVSDLRVYHDTYDAFRVLQQSVGSTLTDVFKHKTCCH